MAEEKKYYSITKKFWAIFAPFYDIMVLPISSVRDRVVDFTGAEPGAKILDIATGTGKQAFAFAKRGYNVTGVDFSEAMLRIARRKNRYDNLKFEVADATKLPFKAHSFDVSCISFALHEMPLTIKERTLQEMVRVTKPKGTIVVVDYALPENKIGKFLIYHLVHLYEGEHYVKFIKTDLGALLAKSGIEVKEQVSILRGGGRIWKGITNAGN